MSRTHEILYFAGQAVITVAGLWAVLINQHLPGVLLILYGAIGMALWTVEDIRLTLRGEKTL